MAHKRIVGGLAAAALTTSSLGVAGPALAAGTHHPPRHPAFVRVDANIDREGDLHVTFIEVGLKQGQKVKVVGEADAKASFAVIKDEPKGPPAEDLNGAPPEPKPKIVVVTVKDHVISEPFKARAGYSYRYPSVRGWVTLEHPELRGDDHGRPGPGDLGAMDRKSEATLIKVTFKDVTLKDKKTGASLTLPDKFSEKFNVVKDRDHR